MHITEVVIQGFKSYRDQVKLQNLSTGLNAIVGHNGSGKSNLFAAIRFVLADMYAQMSREDRLSLLHEGDGPVVLNAYVEITIDNHEQRMPTGTEQVIIRRTVGMKKDEYQLNRKSATKQEIQALLESAGFNLKSNPYFIVAQGRIQALCNARDEERLELLKEVAGTRVFEDRKEESEKILRETEMKMEKVSQLLEFISSRIVELEKESVAAEQLKQKQLRKRLLLSHLERQKLDELTEDLQQIVNDRQEVSDQLDTVAEMSTSKQSDLQQLTEDLDQLKSTQKMLLDELNYLVQQQSIDDDDEINFMRDDDQNLDKSCVNSDILQKSIQQLEKREFELKQRREKQKLVVEKKNLRRENWKKIQLLQQQKQKFESRASKLKQSNHHLINQLKQIRKLKELNPDLCPLFELFRNDPVFDSAIEAVAGNQLFNVVCDSPATVKNLMSQLRNHQIQQTFIPIASIKVAQRQDMEDVEMLIDKLQITNEKYRKAVEFVFNRWQLIADLHETGAQKNAVTLDGDLVRKKSLTGGYQRLNKLKVIRELSHIDNELSVINNSLLELEESIKLIDAELSKESFDPSIDKQLAKVKKLLSQLTSRRESVHSSQQNNVPEKSVDKVKDELENTQEMISNLQQKLNNLNMAVGDLQEKEETFKQQLQQLTLKQFQLQQERQQSIQKLTEYGQSSAKLKLSVQQITKELSQLEDVQISHNADTISVIEQFQQFQKRRQHLVQRKQELEKSRQSIIDLINLLEQRKIETISQTFSQLSQKFSETFHRLTKGSAHLTINKNLSNENQDPFTGVSINVSFNKTSNFSPVHQLSGGQQSLVALALILAIQSIDPAPFYLFDEIDANLDAAYRQSVAEAIAELSQNAQFIVTTFRPEFLQFAQNFYKVQYNGRVSCVEQVNKEDVAIAST